PAARPPARIRTARQAREGPQRGRHPRRRPARRRRFPRDGTPAPDDDARHPDCPGSPMTIRVLLADDQRLVREAFAMLVDSAADMEVVGQAGTGREAVELARDRKSVVAVMYIRTAALV